MGGAFLQAEPLSQMARVCLWDCRHLSLHPNTSFCQKATKPEEQGWISARNFCLQNKMSYLLYLPSLW